MKLIASFAAVALGVTAVPAHADLPANAPVRHVLLISVDGLHSTDLAHFLVTHPDSTLAHLAATGIDYTHAHTVAPADSYPGLMALVTGGTPAVTGIYYDDSYDRALAAPGGECRATGTRVAYNEEVDAKGGNRIDPAKLPRDPAHGCAPVFPHAHLRVNTIFEVVRNAGGYTAWTDKHPTYEIVSGPSGQGVDDLFLPEIGANYEGMNDVPTTEITGSLAKTERYDAMKAHAVLNEIAGRTHDGSHAAPVPSIFGMNFQSINVAAKLHGWANAEGQPTPGLDSALGFVDKQLGGFTKALAQQGLLDDTLVIITAKHGNGPIDGKLLRKIDESKLEQVVNTAVPGALAQVTGDHGALVWLHDTAATEQVADALRAHADELGIHEVLTGKRLEQYFPSPATDSRSPDLVVVTNDGVIYTKPHDGKLAEHGGFHDDDTSVALLLSNPRLAGKGQRIDAAVMTTEVAPTLLTALGLAPDTLQAVQRQGTGILPAVIWTPRAHGIAQSTAGEVHASP